MTNKYAEGYPGKRYYGGCEFVDVAESLAIARAKAAVRRRARERAAAFGRAGQHGGLLRRCSSRATRVLGMNLAHGGHLTHGHPLNFSGKLYTIVPYGVRQDDERIDYEELERLAHEHKPKMIMVGASAYPRIIDFARIAAVAAGGRRADGGGHGAHRGARRRRRASRARSRTPTSSPRPRTRRCAARAPA